MFEPVKKVRIYEDIVSSIRGIIENGALITGDRLPSERKLSAAFKVSRPSVREALKTLESHGYLEIRRGEGAFISRNPMEQNANPHAPVTLSEREFQIQILEMRRLVEPQIAFLAAERTTKDEMSRMERTLSLQKEKVMMGETGSDLDKIFHYLIARAAKNRLLMHLIDTATDLFSENRNKYLQVAERPEKSIYHHEEILNAIATGDGGLAANFMNNHLDDIHETLFASG